MSQFSFETVFTAGLHRPREGLECVWSLDIWLWSCNRFSVMVRSVNGEASTRRHGIHWDCPNLEFGWPFGVCFYGLFGLLLSIFFAYYESRIGFLPPSDLSV